MSVGPSGRKIILDENGKPCRSCNTLLDFKAVTKSATKTVADDCPPDVEQLGRSTWTFLHSVAAKYPEQASEEQQEDMRTFLRVFGNIYPCWFCAKDFRQYMEKDKPKVRTQEEFGKWLCDAHNEVNEKLGKKKFDCNLWKERWKDGWKDGRCD
ncbi:putative FAD dependent sulfhydryl oxidase Erv1 [Ogataea parapolymorpha DL-1]|uniref:Sulfhydryl oxidase n=1 Tax=Ogataea parapolymorpha (strain ATCC 26012 / BCRC 20466 / JCM 22074 / NRRL Y-7560 / DL-1) TaxID=871575 RepID=W1QCR7_OGAPD|nr:putative FAD dependent sulfhydryl oxidase Erv1 [Ogataea parapolymorpha DL-1]ESW98831.1 putative FAD dependent sulfhydryl oxidase Erv1 [Ogataea parapolymorpha DL-1]